MTWVWPLELTEWKERTDSHKLSSDLHRALWHVCALRTHTHLPPFKQTTNLAAGRMVYTYKPSLKRLRKNQKFKASLGYILRPCHYKQKQMPPNPIYLMPLRLRIPNNTRIKGLLFWITAFCKQGLSIRCVATSELSSDSTADPPNSWSEKESVLK